MIDKESREAPQPATDRESLWQIEDVARYLRVSVHQAREYYLRESLPVVDLGRRVYRFDPESVRAWAKAREHAL